jgi:hypothetical protein
MKVKMIGLFCALSLSFGMAQADTAAVATLAQVSGKVMVNKGKGFVTAKSGMVLADNDRLITLDESSAAVVFADGCLNTVKANSALAISKALGCKAQAASVNAPMTKAAPIRYAAVGDTPPVTNPIIPVIGTGSVAATFAVVTLLGMANDDNGISGQ